MPPKKKRGGSQPVNAPKTRGRKPKAALPSLETEPAESDQDVSLQTDVEIKPAARKVGRPAKLKRGPRKKVQIDVASDEIADESSENGGVDNSAVENSEIEEATEIGETTTPTLVEEEVMQTEEVDKSASETVEIAEQLESLTVEAENEEEVIEERAAVEGEIEYSEMSLEYVTEEELVVGETSEVVIEDIPSVAEEVKSEVSDLMHDLEDGDETNSSSAQFPSEKTVEPNEKVEEDTIPPPETEVKEENEANESKPAKSIEEELALMETSDKPPSPKPPAENEAPKIDPPNDKEQPIDKKSSKPAKQPKKRTHKPKEPKKPPSLTNNRKKQQQKQTKQSKKDANLEEVRRSSRIKSISVQKQRSKGLVKAPKPPDSESIETSNSSSLDADNKPTDSPNIQPQMAPDFDNTKPVKVKSRWRRSSELEMNVLTPAAVVMETCGDSEKIAQFNEEQVIVDTKEIESRLKQFVHLKDNLYLTDRMACKEAKKMTCDCFLTQEEIERGELGCGEDCLNRLLMIECSNLCPISDRCTNKKFQKNQFAPVEVFKTDKKGLGLRAAANIPYGEFILEYVGEVLDHEEFDRRADDYSNDKNRHYYFMSLRADAIIDATMKGNISRFINHSCEPNAETQKWTVNGELRIGFFSTRTILAGEEITFDYRFQRYGKEAQKCYCEAATCRGWLGEEPDDDDDEYEDISEEEEPEMEETKEVQEKTEKVAEKVSKPKKEPKPKKERKKCAPRKARKDIFEDLDQLDDEIDMLVTTGLKNQAHTLKLSRLMVRAKEPAQRTKLLRILRRGELPCRRLFLDYHGLRLMHGYMTDAQDLAKTDKKFDSLRLEMLQTLATLPIPNKTMLQDSKVLSTVEKWSTKQVEMVVVAPDSDSSPLEQVQQDEQKPQERSVTPIEEDKQEMKLEVVDEVKDDDEIRKSAGMDHEMEQSVENGGSTFTFTHGKELAEEISNIFQEEAEAEPVQPAAVKEEEVKSAEPVKIEEKQPQVEEQPNYEEEITALALKLLEEWSNLKEVFKIPKKERIEQMKEHEREANRGYIAGLGLEPDAEKKSESRYRLLKRYRTTSDNKSDYNNQSNRKYLKLEDRNIVNFPKLNKHERRKMFALQVEQREEERRRKQRELWREHEQHCILLGTDPRLTAPFDPTRGYQCIWNPQIGQWQNYPLQNANMLYGAAAPVAGVPAAPPYPSYLHTAGILTGNPLHPLPALPYQEEVIKKEEDYTQVKFMGPIPPPVKLPPKWKCCKDKYGRPYYYHIRLRKSQWEPPPLSQPQNEDDDSSETTSSSDTSSLSSETSSEESDSDDDVDDSRLLFEVHKQINSKQNNVSGKNSAAEEDEVSISPQEEVESVAKVAVTPVEAPAKTEESVEDAFSTVDARLKELFNDENKGQTTAAAAVATPPAAVKRKRAGLVHEIIISPRTEEDRLQFREDLKRYKQNKEKLKKEKELIQQHNKKHGKTKRPKTEIKLKVKEMTDSNTEHARRIRETFRSSMATFVVSVLNAYRKPDCKEGRIGNTEDFKHLARKLTHFVMLKEMKHIEKIDELICTENVKGKAKEYIRKYMSKFGENYQKRMDEPDF